MGFQLFRMFSFSLSSPQYSSPPTNRSLRRLSTYETKIRDKLGLRKKLKKSDWPAVYQHVRNRGDKPTGIYVNGTRIPWKKAWKEIRRSGYRSASGSMWTLHIGFPLGASIIDRSPRPIISASSGRSGTNTIS